MSAWEASTEGSSESKPMALLPAGKEAQTKKYGSRTVLLTQVLSFI
jgi:hypothetical protein